MSPLLEVIAFFAENNQMEDYSSPRIFDRFIPGIKRIYTLYTTLVVTEQIKIEVFAIVFRNKDRGNKVDRSHARAPSRVEYIR